MLITLLKNLNFMRLLNYFMIEVTEETGASAYKRSQVKVNFFFFFMFYTAELHDFVKALVQKLTRSKTAFELKSLDYCKVYLQNHLHIDMEQSSI